MALDHGVFNSEGLYPCDHCSKSSNFGNSVRYSICGPVTPSNEWHDVFLARVLLERAFSVRDR
jgi:hypothetical protein